MQDNNKVKAFPKKKPDTLEELLENSDIDEMGLLDLIFLEEILNQKAGDKAV